MSTQIKCIQKPGGEIFLRAVDLILSLKEDENNYLHMGQKLKAEAIQSFCNQLKEMMDARYVQYR